MGDWNWIWRVRAPHRIKTFLWLVLHSKVLSNAERFRRKLTQSPSCVICSAEVEDLDHLLRSCPNAIEAWQGLQPQGVTGSTNNEGLYGWIQHNITRTHEDPDWPTKFLVTMWYIWKWRCMHCFGTRGEVPREKDLFLLAKFREIITALNQDEQIQGIHHMERGEIRIRWEPPMD